MSTQPVDRSSATPSESGPRTAGDMLSMARAFLRRKGMDEWRLEAELLVAHALGLDRLRLFLALDRPVSPVEIDRARDLLVRRGKREPTAYIIGSREFYQRSFRVGPGVLVPRPETELLVDRARELARELPDERRASPWIGELGAGSGCVAISCALEIDGARVVAAEISPAAVAIARANLAALVPEGERTRVEIVEGDGLEVLARAVRERGRKLDVLVSNPPYVTREEARSLAPEVRDYEPALALFAPSGDPDHWVRALLDRARELLAPGGVLLVELGASQSPRAAELARERGFEPRLVRDLARIERVLEVRA